MRKLVETIHDVILMTDGEFEYFLNVFPDICNEYFIKEELIDKVIRFIIKQRNKIKEAN